MSDVCLAVRQLAEFLLRGGDIDSRFAGFDRALEGARIHRRLQKAAGGDYAAEVSLACEREVGGISYRIEGRADGIYTDENGIAVIDEIKTTAIPSSAIHEDMNPCHWAQGMIYAAIYGREKQINELNVRLTYYQIDEEKVIYFTRRFTLDELEAYFTDLLEQYAPWARRGIEHRTRRSASLSALTFPFSSWRDGQRAMAGEVYRACRDGSILFCQAPTGTGKTMSAVFPALRAMGEGHGDMLFYLTARGTACAAAETALAIFQDSAAPPELYSITLTAKEKVCLCPNAVGRPECIPERCPYAKGYYDRLLPAMRAALDEYRTFSRDVIADVAKKHRICPFELGLDLSEWCDVVIGDYNYLFDPVVHLRRFFETKGDYLFLVDEAHNLPDRARDMYSSAFSKSMLLDAKRALGKGKSRLKSALSQANNMFLAYRKLCDSSASESAEETFSPAAQLSLFTSKDEAISAEAGQDAPAASPSDDNTLFGSQLPLYVRSGTRFYRDFPKPLFTALRSILAPAEAWLEDHREGEAHEEILQMYFSLRDFLRTAEGYDSHYVLQFTAHGAELDITQLCLDPSSFIKKSFSCGSAAVLFSATITPPGYYRSILGCSDARAVALESPFPPENLGLFSLSSISTRYRDRADSLISISDALFTMISAKNGHYLAFFPSYAYLRQVGEVFTQAHPEVPVQLQESGLDEAARTAFLAQFQAQNDETLLGFCVMGGVFGEGIDLAGRQLIGCAVVGVGLPQINPRQEMLRMYYDEAASCGFDFAYRFPGMNKVLQAAGRVIRTPKDKGVVLLIDDRFSHTEYRRLFPPHWAGILTVPDADSLHRGLSAFWDAESLE